LYYFVKG